MTIHNKINSKGNRELDGSARISFVIKRGYSKIMDNYLGGRIFYKQDKKTNYREPRESDGECFRGHEAQNFEAEQMARIQRELK